MDWTVCSRETERDYSWDNHAPHVVAEFARGVLAPAFEGSLTTSRFAALLRQPDSPMSVMLCVSVSTARKDFRHRPIRTMAFLRASDSNEAGLLAAFFAACLREPDAKTLYDSDSPLAQAVESLYQEKTPDRFIEFCKGLPKSDGGGVPFSQRQAIPRDDLVDRKTSADALPSLIGEDAPFLVALTDRTPMDVLGSLGPVFGHATVRIFSKAVTSPEALREPDSQKNFRAAAIGVVVFLAILAAAIIGLGSKGDGDGAGDNSAGVEKRASCDPPGKLDPVGPGQTAATNVPTQAQGQEEMVTNTPPIRSDPDKSVSSATTNASPQVATGTKKLKATSTRTREE